MLFQYVRVFRSSSEFPEMAVSFDNSIGEEGSQEKLNMLDCLQSAELRQQRLGPIFFLLHYKAKA